MTVREALVEAERRLAAAGVETPRVDAELLVAHVLGTTRNGVYACADAAVDGTFHALLARREAREPLAYVLGEWGFRRLVLKTDARALVPRPETEILVERALALVAAIREPRILDVGVGSGAIALALADEHPGARVTGVDTSADALALARENAARLDLSVELREAGTEAAAEGWDLVVSNPPYVETLEGLEPEVRCEPEQALVGGLELYRELARTARTTWFVVEVDEMQAAVVEAELRDAGYRETRITRDLAGRERVVEGRRR